MISKGKVGVKLIVRNPERNALADMKDITLKNDSQLEENSSDEY